MTATEQTLPVIAGDKPHVLKPGHISDDPIEQGRYDALFASMGPGLEATNGLAPAAGNSAVTRVWIEPTAPVPATDRREPAQREQAPSHI